MDVHFTAEEHYRRGRELLGQRRIPEAFEYFRTANGLDPGNARYRSHYGLGLALVERRFNEGLELCRSAAKEEFFDADLYHNLARIHLEFGFRGEALRYLRRGLMIDAAHPGMLDDMARLGLRRLPVLRFLPRSHALNRWLGRLRLRRFARRAA